MYIYFKAIKIEYFLIAIKKKKKKKKKKKTKLLTILALLISSLDFIKFL